MCASYCGTPPDLEFIQRLYNQLNFAEEDVEVA